MTSFVINIKSRLSIISFKADTRIAVLFTFHSHFTKLQDIRLNCSHYVKYDFPSSNERNMISRELNVTKDQYIKATKQPHSFLYVDKPMKTVKRDFYGNI